MGEEEERQYLDEGPVWTGDEEEERKNLDRGPGLTAWEEEERKIFQRNASCFSTPFF